MKNKAVIILGLIIILAIFFRVRSLSAVPSHPSLDEVSTGYNAYSILDTGRDEFGSKFPVLLRAYDDWRPALYVYLVIPFIKILDLTVLAVRLPSAILSIISIASFFFLSKFIFSFTGIKKYSTMALFSTLMLAISPWHIYISRLGHEVNAAVAFFIIGFTFFTLSFREKENKKSWFIFLSFVFFALSFDFYQSAKIVVPLFVASLLLIFLHEILPVWKKFLLPITAAIIITLPVLYNSLQPNSLIRLQATSIFNVPFDVQQKNAQKLIEYKKNNDYISLFLTNRRIYPMTAFVGAFFSHFNPEWASVNNGNNGREEFKVPGFGLIYGFEIILIILGIIYLLLRKKWIILSLLSSWIVIGILPSALTSGAPHAMRSFNIIGAPQILEAFGICLLLQIFSKKKNFQNFVLIALGVIIVMSTFNFYNAYFDKFKKINSFQFQYGVQEAFLETAKIENSYNSIIVSNKDYLRASYMYYLFFSKYDPKSYQKSGGTKSGWFDVPHVIGKYRFEDVLPSKTDKTLFIKNYSEFETGKIIKEISDLAGKKVILLVEE